MVEMYSQILIDESETIRVGHNLGRCLSEGGTVYLTGTLGAGKTTLCRGVLNSFGHSGAVKSPTYTLVEPYELNGIVLYHFDLYRLAHPEELEFMGIRDYFESGVVCLVEWPEKGGGIIPEPDLEVNLTPDKLQRKLEILAKTARGDQILAKLKEYRE